MKQFQLLVCFIIAVTVNAYAQYGTPTIAAFKQQVLPERNLVYQKPAGFSEQPVQPYDFYTTHSKRMLINNTPFFLQADKNEEVLIYAFILNEEKEKQGLPIWEILIRDLADTANSKVIHYAGDKLKRFHADHAGEFDLKQMDVPYRHIKTVFFNKAGEAGNYVDVLLYYFYKDGININEYTKNAAAVLSFK